jgi:hypothetical protein
MYLWWGVPLDKKILEKTKNSARAEFFKDGWQTDT